jgi:hypothetical protein
MADLNQIDVIVAKLKELEAQNGVLLQRIVHSESKNENLVLTDIAKTYLPKHWQMPPMAGPDRKKILQKYKFVDMPQQIKDGNGFATKGVKSPYVRDFLTKCSLARQRDNFDVMRMCINALIQAEESKNQIPDWVGTFVADVTRISIDNQQRTCKEQLDLALQVKGLKSAETFIEKEKLDRSQTSIFQEHHVDAIKKLVGFQKDLASSSNSIRPRGGGNFGGQQRQKFGGRGNPNQPYYPPWPRGRGRGRGGWGNRGRGGGPKPNYPNNNNFQKPENP